MQLQEIIKKKKTNLTIILFFHFILNVFKQFLKACMSTLFLRKKKIFFLSLSLCLSIDSDLIKIRKIKHQQPYIFLQLFFNFS